MRHFGRFLFNSLISLIAGVIAGTIIYLVWMDTYLLWTNYPNMKWENAVMVLVALPLALLIALAYALPIGLLPTLFLGSLLKCIFDKAKLKNTKLRVLTSAIFGAAVGTAMMSRVGEGGVLGLIYGTAIGATWFVFEPVFLRSRRQEP